MTVYQIISLLFGSGILASCFKYFYSRLKENDRKTESVQLGVQALLRSKMIDEYNKWSERGYAPIYARENFQNMYNQYHNLGMNGVMDDLLEKFKELPTQKHEEGE